MLITLHTHYRVLLLFYRNTKTSAHRTCKLFQFDAAASILPIVTLLPNILHTKPTPPHSTTKTGCQQRNSLRYFDHLVQRLHECAKLIWSHPYANLHQLEAGKDDRLHSSIRIANSHRTQPSRKLHAREFSPAIVIESSKRVFCRRKLFSEFPPVSATVTAKAAAKHKMQRTTRHAPNIPYRILMRLAITTQSLPGFWNSSKFGGMVCDSHLDAAY
jgi:hypothetical protein